MHNVYIVVAHDNNSENEYAELVYRKLKNLSGVHSLYSLSFTRTQIREAYYDNGEDYFLPYLANIGEYGTGCHFHILIIDGETVHDEAFWREAGSTISRIKNYIYNWRDLFSFCVFSTLSRDQCILLMKCEGQFVKYYFTNNDNKAEKALELYVGSVETKPPSTAFDINIIQEIRTPFLDLDEITRKVEPSEDKINLIANEQIELKSKEYYLKDTLCRGTYMPTKEIIIFSAGSAHNYMLNVKSLLQDILTSRGMTEYRVVSWETGVKKSGKDKLTSLVQKGKEMQVKGGYALCLFTPDYPCIIKGEKVFVSCNNVWLEYGLFAGLLGLDRVFVLCPFSDKTLKKSLRTGSIKEESRKWHMPSDFVLHPYEYEYSSNFENVQDRIYALLNDIVTEISTDYRQLSDDTASRVAITTDYKFSTKM